VSFRNIPNVLSKEKCRIKWKLKKVIEKSLILKTGPEEAQYFHVRPPIGFI